MRFPVGGHEIDYEIRGEGRSIVMLHGMTVDRRIMIESCEGVLAARPGWRRIYLDLPGHGASRGDRSRASADGLVSALATFVREVGGPEAALVGYSYGGYLAQGLLRDVSDLRGALLVCPIVEPDFGKRMLPAKRVVTVEPDLHFADEEERETFDGEAVVQTHAVLEVFHRVLHPAHAGTDREFVTAVRGRYAMSQLVTGALQGISRPVTVVCGRDDYWVGFEDAARVLVRAIPGCHFVVLPDCGHLAPVEQPVRFAAVLEDWLGRVEG
jgi:pimeloyl-ACP methyl ester carboxylesterase